MKKQKICECGVKFLPYSSTQVFCGSTLYEKGCSFKKFQERRKIKDARGYVRRRRNQVELILEKSDARELLDLLKLKKVFENLQIQLRRKC